MGPFDVDVLVIGAGVVGCAAARALAEAGIPPMVVDAAAREGTGITSRNSGVIHAGIYYPPHWLRTRLCVEGRERLERYCVAKQVPHRLCGKFVVAFDPAEVARLEALLRNAHAAGATSVRPVAPADVVRRGPELRRPAAALFSPGSGIVDPHVLTARLRADAEAAGATFAFRGGVRRIEVVPGGFRLDTARGPVRARRVVNAAGLGADVLARQVVPSAPAIHPCRGDYFRIRRRLDLDVLVYPVRTPQSRGLGLHLTPDMGGAVRIGPSARYVEARDDFGGPAPDPGPFLASARRLLRSPLGRDDLVYDGCGIRPKLRGPDDPDERDFLLLAAPEGALHLLGIESPGLTAALALAERVARWARGDDPAAP
ncbi:MAG: NAD(P)/FAD-dependent oxidoreductase [Deltaproteobacteria bacterium]|nr:MAG: NAD(P)/FAD-dependent oxidoreductase [Deltaproteobacteria bacterium]